MTGSERSVAERGSTAVLPTYGARPVTFVRGEGCTLYDDAGVAYLDLVAGVAVLALGHCHPEPIAAFATQARILGHVSNLYWSEPSVKLAERLKELSGLSGGVFLCNSGAEANETLIKLARRRGRVRGGPSKHEIVCLEQAFHGRTLGALAATWAHAKKEPFEPLPSGFRHVPADDVAALRAAVGPSTAAILIEPVQGEGGVHPVSAAFLAEARALADRHDALLLLDEVQTGIGRTGAWFAFQRLGVAPDAIALAKGLGSGLPVGAVVTGHLEGGFQPGDHGTTFGGSAPVAAGALAVLDTIERDGLVERARTLGEALRDALAALPGVTGVRGLGLLLGVELERGGSAAVAERLLLEERVIVNAVTPTALRLCPPLVLSDAEAERAVAAIGRAIG